MEWALVNCNAGGFRPDRLEALRRTFTERVAVTADVGEVDACLRRALDAGAKELWVHGGDGTVLHTLRRLRALCETPPPVGVVPWGTGNALAHWLGGLEAAEASLDMLRVNGRLTPIVGTGLHAALVHDAERWRKVMPSKLAWSLVPPWTLLRTRRQTVRVVTRGPAQPIDAHGEVMGPARGEGSVLHDGSALLVDAATCPVIGFGHRLFPHAERPGCFQLRVLTMSRLEWLRTWPAACRGELDHEGSQNWLVEDVVIEGATPLSLAGDDDGTVDEVRVQLGAPVRLLTRRPSPEPSRAARGG